MVTPLESPAPPAGTRRANGLYYGAALAVLLAALLGWGWWLSRGKMTARQALQRGDLAAARSALERYLFLFPDDAEARLQAGDAYLLDNSLDPVEAAQQALEHYSQVPESTPQGATAHVKAGRAAFLVLQEPARARAHFLKAIALDADQFEAHYLLWQLYNMTERFFECEPVFREVYRLCPEEDRPFRLREWYSSQFSPLSACSQLDYMLRFRREEEVPSEEIAMLRLSKFLEYEPQAPETAAAFAQWHLRNQTRETALEILEKISPRETALKEPFYAATLVEVLIELGQVDRAREVYAQWQGPREGYHAQRVAGMYAQEVEGDLEGAAAFYRQAVQTWPGGSDWLLLNRLARCLALAGQKSESEKIAEQAKRVEELTTLEVHQLVRKELGDLKNPDGLEVVADFYESIGRDWEQQAWLAVVENLRKSATTKPADVDQN